MVVIVNNVVVSKMAVNICNRSSQEREAGRSVIQGHPLIHNEFMVSRLERKEKIRLNQIT